MTRYQLRAMRVAVRRMLYAVAALGAVACGGAADDTPVVETDVNVLPRLFCAGAMACPAEAPIVQEAFVMLVNARTTWDGCLEIGEELRDSAPQEAVTDMIQRLTEDPCLWYGWDGP